MRSSSKAYSTLFMLNMPHLRRTGFMIRFYSQKNCFRDLHTFYFCAIEIKRHSYMYVELYDSVVVHQKICVELLFATKQQALETCSNISLILSLLFIRC